MQSKTIVMFDFQYYGQESQKKKCQTVKSQMCTYPNEVLVVLSYFGIWQQMYILCFQELHIFKGYQNRYKTIYSRFHVHL